MKITTSILKRDKLEVYEELKAALRDKKEGAHDLAAELLSSPKEITEFVKFIIAFVSQFIQVVTLGVIQTVYQNINTLLLIGNASDLKCQQAGANLVDTIIAHASPKLVQLHIKVNDTIKFLHSGSDKRIDYIDVMKLSMCSQSFSLLTTMCECIRKRDSEGTIQVIQHMLSCKTLVVQVIQYPDISSLKAKDRQDVLWYCWKALLYSQDHKPSEKYIRYLLSLYVLSFERKLKLITINLLYSACTIACVEKTKDTGQEVQSTNVRHIYDTIAEKSDERISIRSAKPEFKAHSEFASALKFIPQAKLN